MGQAVESLQQQVWEALDFLERLAGHAGWMGEEDAKAVFRTAELIRLRMDREHLYVAVVGEKKAGKSTFLNALLGAELLGVAVRECTATITELRHGEEPDWLAEREDGHRLRFAAGYRDRRAALQAELAETEASLGPAAADNAFVGALRQELVENERELLQRFAEDVRSLTDLRTAKGEIALLDIRWPTRRVPADVILLDTPGVNTEQQEHVARAWRALELYADGCLLLSDMQQAMSSSTLDFLGRVRSIVPHVALVLTKIDRAIENAIEVGGDPDEEVAEALRVARRRFAEQSGRDADDVLTFAVAAEPALRGEPAELVRAFEAEVARLFEVLRRERPLVLASRAAAAFQRATVALERGTREALAQLEANLASIEAQRIPNPDAFVRMELERLDPSITRKGAFVADALARELPGALLEVDAALVAAVRGVRTRDGLRELLGQLDVAAKHALEGASRDMQRRAAHSLDLAWTALYPQAIHALRERYQLVDQGRSLEARRMGGLPPLEDIAGGVGRELSAALDGGREGGLRWGPGGRPVSAILGLHLRSPETLPDALAAGFSQLFTSLDRQKDDVARQVSEAIDGAREAVERELLRADGPIAAALRAQVEHGLHDAVKRYSAWIEEVLRAEARRIEEERARIGELEGLRAELRRREEALQAAMAEARSESGAL